MESATERLIEEIKKRPCLYDSNREDYRDLRKEEKCWRKIGRILNAEPALLKKEWMSLKYCYLSALEDTKARKPKLIEKYLSFLAPFTAEVVSSLYENYDDQNIQLSDGSPQETHATGYDYMNVVSQVHTHQGRKGEGLTDTTVENQDREMEITDDSVAEFQDLELFFKSAYETTRRFPRLQQIKVKEKIMKVICETEERMLEQEMPLNSAVNSSFQ